MNSSKMKNMVILKDLPSNIIEEAYVVLRPGVKFEKKTEESQKNIAPNYILNEAESIIDSYLSDSKKQNLTNQVEENTIKKKYKILKNISFILVVLFILNIFIQIKF